MAQLPVAQLPAAQLPVRPSGSDVKRLPADMVGPDLLVNLRVLLYETQPHLLVTAWRSFISDLSNQTWGQDLTMDLWMTPIRPPWT